MASILKAGRRVLLWSTSAAMAVPMLLPVVMADDKTACESGPCCKDKIRPSQLPIYDEPEDLYDITYHVSEKGQVQEGVSVVRKELEEAVAATKELRDQAEHIYQTGKAHTAGQIDYLLDEENVAARAGAIAAGGLVGLLMGSRKKGGIFKKLVYTSVGVGVSSAALYPQYTRQYSQELANNASIYATVAYNFLVGVKPQVNGDSEVQPASTPAPASTTTKSESVESNPKKEGSDSAAKNADSCEVKTATVEQKQEVEGDPGQSNPADADMYTTRS